MNGVLPGQGWSPRCVFSGVVVAGKLSSKFNDILDTKVGKASRHPLSGDRLQLCIQRGGRNFHDRSGFGP
jgi:hypothetical protein